MNFFKKHELFFGFGIIAFFILPALFYYLGYVDITKERTVFYWFFMMVLAIFPALIWIRIFYKADPVSKLAVIMAFLAGCLSSIPIFFYKELFINQSEGNFIFFRAEAVNFQTNIASLFGFDSFGHLAVSADNGVMWAMLGVLTIYTGVGVLEEISKQVSVNPGVSKYLAGMAAFIAIVFLFYNYSIKNLVVVLLLLLVYFLFLRFLLKHIKVQSIDDFIEVGIISAIGFAFIENIHYFIDKMGAISNYGFVFFVLVRVTVVTVVHVLCSGVLAYHLGLAHFAKPVLQDELREGRKLPFVHTLHKYFGFKTESIFKFEQVSIGLFLAIMIHAFYNFFMQFQWNVMGAIPLFALVMPVYFIGGLWYLFYLFDQKEDHKRFGKLVEKPHFYAIQNQ